MNPYPGPNSVIVLDNCSTHRSAALREIVEASGCLLIFLPAYSPDFNPIEESFSCCECSRHSNQFILTVVRLVKQWLRRHWLEFQDSHFPEQDLREACFRAVTAENTRGWYSHSGYL